MERNDIVTGELEKLTVERKLLPPAPEDVELEAELMRWRNMDHILTCGG